MVHLSVVSDVHGNLAALARVARTAERLVVLGDLLNYVDYHDHGSGILGRLFGADRVATFAALRASGRFAELHEYNASLWATLSDPAAALADIVAARYRQVLAILPPDTLLTLGNVDVASVWNEVAGDILPCLDGEVVRVGEHRFGFVAGGASRARVPHRRPAGAWRPVVRTAADYRAAVTRIGPVDVLCSHVPPDLPLVRYDTVPARLEMYGPGLLEAIDAYQPRFSLFGHVHQPLSGRTRRGRTECVNVGHFQRTETPFVLDLDAG